MTRAFRPVHALDHGVVWGPLSQASLLPRPRCAGLFRRCNPARDAAFPLPARGNRHNPADVRIPEWSDPLFRPHDRIGLTLRCVTYNSPEMAQALREQA